MSNPLQRKRNAVGLTQAQIAKLVGVTERGYRAYEASETARRKTIPDALTAIRIARALDSTVEELWNAGEYPSDDAGTE